MSAYASAVHHPMGHANLSYGTAEGGMHCLAHRALLVVRGVCILSAWLDV